MSSSEKPFAEWVGRASESEDIVTDRLVRSFRAILEPYLAPVAADEAPLGLHWCLSPAIEPMAALGQDGHPAKNLNLPPVPLPRRMWAGGSIEWIAPLKIGDSVRHVSTIRDVQQKIGRTGELWFVTVDHVYKTVHGVAIRERQDIVYREAATVQKMPPSQEHPSAPRHADRSWTVETPPTLLFRYSAVTFNGHRIHYDMPYATGVEGYDGLVVHGPIQATLLLNLAASGGQPLRQLDYRGLAPAIAGRPIDVCSNDSGEILWTAGHNGVIHMEAKAFYR